MNEHLFTAGKRAPSAVDTAIETIKSLLISRRLKPGDLMPSEGELAGQLAISRGSLREAMKILSAFGVVEIRRGDGTYVATTGNRKLFDPLLFNLLVTERDMKELAQLRLLVEMGIARLIVENASDEDLELLSGAYRELERQIESGSADGETLFACDLEFHLVMGRITKNSLVENVYGFVIELFAPTMHAGHGLSAHKRLLEALRSRDVEAACAAIQEHEEIWRKLNMNEQEPRGGGTDQEAG